MLGLTQHHFVITGQTSGKGQQRLVIRHRSCLPPGGLAGSCI